MRSVGSQQIGQKDGSVTSNHNFILLTDSATDKAKTDDLNHTMFTREEMGRLVWTVMHLYSAYVPEDPTEEEKEEVHTLITLL